MRINFSIDINRNNISLWLSIIAIAVCSANFFIFNIRVEPYEFDVYGVLVTILAVLVTVLIAWQIYTAIKIETIIDEKIKESEHKVENNSLQYISSIALEFYSHFSVMSYVNNVPILTRLSFLVGGIIYGSLIENIPQEFLKPYYLLLDNFENLIIENEDEIIKLSEEEKQAILTKIKEHPDIAIFRKLERILDN